MGKKPELLTRIVEVFGVFTAVSFVCSCMINWLIFDGAWGINYFQIASPQDVLMNGCLLLVIVGVVLALVLVIIHLALVFTVERKNRAALAYLSSRCRGVSPQHDATVNIFALALPLALTTGTSSHPRVGLQHIYPASPVPMYLGQPSHARRARLGLTSEVHQGVSPSGAALT